MSDSESKPDPLEAFAQLPNCRDLIQRAGMQLRIDEMGKEVELRESEVIDGLACQQLGVTVAVVRRTGAEAIGGAAESEVK